MISLLKEINLIDTGILPSLISDYLNRQPSLSHLTNYPFSFSAFEQAIADKAKDGADRKLITEVLQSQYADIPTSQSVKENIELLLAENTFTVVAAHQPCLFMGSLYNVYKISCTINITRQLKQAFPDFNFVPVFWLGSEDHDTEELNHTYINGNKIEWQGAGSGASGRWETASMRNAVDELKTLTSNVEISLILEEGLKKYAIFGKFTQYFVNEIFKDFGLIVLDQDDKRLKQKFIEVIKDEVLHSRAVEVLKENVEFLEQNYKAQAKPRDINFFYLGQNYRERIVYNTASNKFEVNNQPSVSFSREEIVAEIEQHPERFSPNVIFRPLYQEMLLPNLAFVGGAGELSYWLELKPLFDYHKVNYPMQVQRNSAVIIHPTTQKKIDKLGLQMEGIFSDVEQLINSYVKQNSSEALSLAREKKQVSEIYDSVILKAEAADVTLKNTALAEKQKAIATLENMEAKMLKAEKRKQETAIAQIRAIHSNFFPENVLQERRENFIPFYNPEFISEMITQLNPFDKSFKVFLKD